MSYQSQRIRIPSLQRTKAAPVLMEGTGDSDSDSDNDTDAG